MLSKEGGRMSQAYRQKKQRPRGERDHAYLGDLPWFGMTSMEKVAEDEGGEPGHSQILRFIRSMQGGLLKVSTP